MNYSLTSITDRAFVFTFYELKNTEFNCTTNVYVVNTDNYTFIGDTYLGPKYMDLIFKNIPSNHNIIVFNSHSDWDHVWGNCYFKNNIIVAHKNCFKNLQLKGHEELEKYKSLQTENIKIKLPNLIFTDKLSFIEEGIEFFYSPGHTNDSSTLWDKINNVLFVGDNVEDPKPYFDGKDKNKFIKTLKIYLKLNVKIIVPGHGDITDNSLIEKNLKYLEYY